jgi:hypothetical protein
MPSLLGACLLTRRPRHQEGVIAAAKSNHSATTTAAFGRWTGTVLLSTAPPSCAVLRRAALVAGPDQPAERDDWEPASQGLADPLR